MKNFAKYLENVTLESEKIGFNYFKYDNKQLVPLIKLKEKTELLSLTKEEKKIILFNSI